MLTLYNHVNACAIFLPVIVILGEHNSISVPPGEGDEEEEAPFLGIPPGFWVSVSATGILGLVIGYVAGLQIQVTSPLTHNISGTVKAALQTVMATQVTF